MTNMPVTVMLREGGDGEPEWTLSVRGRAERARVELRTARAGMVIAPEVPEEDVLSQVLGTADELETIQGRLRRLANEVPEPPDEMLEHEMPYDLHAELRASGPAGSGFQPAGFGPERRAEPSALRAEPAVERAERHGLESRLSLSPEPSIQEVYQ